MKSRIGEMQRPVPGDYRTDDFALRKIENSEVVTIHNSEYTFLCSVSYSNKSQSQRTMNNRRL